MNNLPKTRRRGKGRPFLPGEDPRRHALTIEEKSRGGITRREQILGEQRWVNSTLFGPQVIYLNVFTAEGVDGAKRSISKPTRG
jgi:hypothetical protein